MGRDGVGMGEGLEGELWAGGLWGGGHVHPHSRPGPQVYEVELHISKVVLADRGDYRLEVKAKDFCDSCGFNIDVEGALPGVGPRVWGLGWGTRSRGWGVPDCGDRLHAQSVRRGRSAAPAKAREASAVLAGSRDTGLRKGTEGKGVWVRGRVCRMNGR